MSTLYIDRRGSELRHQGKALVLRVAGERQQVVPLNLLERVVIQGKMETDTTTLALIADAGITVHLISGRKGERLATLLGSLHNDARRRIAQYRAHTDPRQATAIARAILVRKVQGQRRILQKALARRPDLRQPLSAAIAQLRAIQAQVREDPQNLQRLRGLEGAAAARYFTAFVRLFPAGLGFTGRKRRPPPDPVNALLSLTYTLVHGDALAQVHAAGLDPYLGFLHEPDYARPSLAADLMEPLRPRVDAWVWEQFRERKLRSERFTQRDGQGCHLDKEGRAYFYPAYEEAARPWRKWLRVATYTLVRHLQEETP